ncbi:MAG: selenocysteine-specific translation elongation factor, partial [Acidobacteriota bacterium]
MRDAVVGTAGHIDHGKTLLVKALTGIDADRWEEEKRRGITMDIGFATLETAEGTLHFVDLPGHERFIKNMLAGATGIDLCLLVVAADESVMPQTVEHAEILGLLGVARGVVALNKVDLVDGETRELALLELSEFLDAHGLGALPVVPVSAATGEGLDLLRRELYREASLCPAPPADRPFRLPVDRTFPVKGFGTVVTGTCIDGSVKVEDAVEVLPAGTGSRVRGLQIFGKPVEAARAGQRVAVNLSDVHHADLRRGDLLGRPGTVWPTHLLDVRLSVLPSARRPLKTGAVCTLHLHTQEVEAHVHLAEAVSLAPGEEGLAQLRCPEKVCAWPQDRFILRLPSPARTVAGGEVLLPARRRARWRRGRDRAVGEALRARDALKAMLVEAGPAGLSQKDGVGRLGLMPESLDALSAAGEKAGTLVKWGGGAWWLDAGEASGWLDRAAAWLKARHAGKSPVDSIPRQELLGRWSRMLGAARCEALLQALVAAGRVELEGDRVRPAGHRVTLTPPQRAAWDGILGRLAEAGTPVQTGKELEEAFGPSARQVLPLLVSEGRLRRFGGDFFIAPATLDALRLTLAARGRDKS